MLIGRDDDLARATSSLARPGLVTLTGPGGVGKTTLARALATAAKVPALFVALGGESDAQGMARAVLEAIDVERPRGAMAMRRAVGTALAARGRLLLVLDELEHLLPRAANWIAEWASDAPELSVLATSRHVLGVQDERTVELRPLNPASAAELFIAKAHDVGVTVQPQTLGSVIAPLEGLPLAIELAAHRLRLMSLDQLRDRLDHSEALGEGVARSWDLLEPEERSVLAQCAVFRGGFSLEAAEAVLDIERVVDALQALREKSLVLRSPDGRLRLLEPVRAFAETSAPPSESLLRRHAEFFATTEAPELERANLRFALAHCDDPAVSIELAIQLGVAAPDGPSPDERVLIEKVRDVSAHLDGPSRARMLLVRARALRDDKREEAAWRDALRAAQDDEDLVALAREGLGGCFLRTFRMNEARVELERAHERWEVQGDRRRSVSVLCQLAAVAGSCGRLEDSEAHHDLATIAERHVDDPSLRAQIAAGRGTLALQRGRFDEAAARYRETLTALGPRPTRMAGVARGYLGLTLLFADEPERAVQALRRAVRDSRHAGHTRAIAVFSVILAAAEAWQGPAPVQRHLELARQTNEGHPVWQPVTELYAALVDLATAHELEGERAQVIAWQVAKKISIVHQRTVASGVRLLEVSDDARLALALLEGRASHVFDHKADDESDERPTLELRPDGTRCWLEGQAIDLSARPTLGRLLAVLAEASQRGKSLTTKELVSRVWATEHVSASSGSNRLYVALADLRKRGFEGVLSKSRKGYRIDGTIRLRFEMRVPG